MDYSVFRHKTVHFYCLFLAIIFVFGCFNVSKVHFKMLSSQVLRATRSCGCFSIKKNVCVCLFNPAFVCIVNEFEKIIGHTNFQMRRLRDRERDRKREICHKLMKMRSLYAFYKVFKMSAIVDISCWFHTNYLMLTIIQIFAIAMICYFSVLFVSTFISLVLVCFCRGLTHLL